MFDPINITPAARVYSVSDLNREVRLLLESGLPAVTVAGEISNFSTPRSGHWYFSFKDHNAQIRCAMFKPKNRLLRFTPQEGDQIQLRGRITLYEPRGDYQLIVEHMEPAGEGALRRQFEQLKQQLAAEGLFADDQKQALPSLPNTVGIITSPTGAAVRDIIAVLKRRFPAIRVILYPSVVQGEKAPFELCEAIQTAIERNECDVLIIGRGGGSLEDLSAFNDETLARVLHACPIPTVSAVGHEIDFTIADFVADARAATPSAAAELISPDAQQWQARLQQIAARFAQALQRQLQQHQQKTDWLSRRLQQQHPQRRLQTQHQQLTELERRLQRSTHQHIKQLQQHFDQLSNRLQRQHPAQRVQLAQLRHTQLQPRLQQAMRAQLQRHRQHIAHLSQRLHTVSPLATLDRGYAIASSGEQPVLQSVKKIQLGDTIQVRLNQGKLDCQVTHIHQEDAA